MLNNLLHPGWTRLLHFPMHVIPCPRCSSPQTHKDHNWRWDEEVGSWLCQRPSCKERGLIIKTSAWQRVYAPVPG